jgi:flagellar basal body-associated protein FliL
MADETKDTPATGKSRKSPLLENKVALLGGLVALQLLLAVGLTTLVIMPRVGVGQAASGGLPGAVAQPVKDELGVLLSMGEIIVTLRTEGGLPARFLRITIHLELANQNAAQTAASRMPILRDTVNMTLAERTAADLNRPEGIKGLRDELMRRLNDRLPGDILRHIYFSDLVIQ